MTLKYVKGEANIVADAISRMPIEMHEPSPTPQELETATCKLLGINDFMSVRQTAPSP